jgi:hypothetical protein
VAKSYLILLEFLGDLDEHEAVGLVGDDDAQLVQRQAVLELVRLAARRVYHVQRTVRCQQRALAWLIPASVVLHHLTRILHANNHSSTIISISSSIRIIPHHSNVGAEKVHKLLVAIDELHTDLMAVFQSLFFKR